MVRAKYYPSLMCADMTNLSDEISQLESFAIAGYHADIMDGRFVPNFALGLSDLKTLRSLTNKPIDAHLMIIEPERYVDLFAQFSDMVCIHYEGTVHADRTLRRIKDLGKRTGIAINPGTPVTAIKHLLSVTDYVLVMAVNPGFAGQEFIGYTVAKVRELTDLLRASNPQPEIHVDGGVSPEIIRELLPLGVTGFVLGTSSLFRGSRDYRKAFEELP